MDIDWKVLLDLLQWLLTIAVALAVWLRKPGEEAGAAVTELTAEVRDAQAHVNARLATLEERVKHMPTSEELAELEGTVKAVGAQVEGLSEGLSSVRAQLNRIETYLLQQK